MSCQPDIGSHEKTYLQHDFDTARKLKWQRGVAEYRLHPDQPFRGNHREEAYQECLDCFNILEDLEGADNTNWSVEKGMLRQIANRLRRR